VGCRHGSGPARRAQRSGRGGAGAGRGQRQRTSCGQRPDSAPLALERPGSGCAESRLPEPCGISVPWIRAGCGGARGRSLTTANSFLGARGGTSGQPAPDKASVAAWGVGGGLAAAQRFLEPTCHRPGSLGLNFLRSCPCSEGSRPSKMRSRSSRTRRLAGFHRERRRVIAAGGTRSGPWGSAPATR